MFISQVLIGADPAAKLASTLGLGSGIVLGALLGSLFGGWLVVGPPRRVAATAGFLIGIGIILSGWRLAQPYFWIVDITMNQVFGEGGEQYSGPVLFLIAFSLFRTIAGSAADVVGRLLMRQRA